MKISENVKIGPTNPKIVFTDQKRPQKKVKENNYSFFNSVLHFMETLRIRPLRTRQRPNHKNAEAAIGLSNVQS